jgi:RimJ/RimL family protein N-acetyltransferase
MTSHIDALSDAAQFDRSSYVYTTVPENRLETERYVLDLLREWEKGLIVPFAQVSVQSDRAVGVTRFMTLRRREEDDRPFAAEIGGTWLGAQFQRTGINSEAKLLLLGYAFEVWNVARVDLKSDARNERSRAAILRLGATFEGVLRQWQPSLVVGEEGLYRDTAMFSVTQEEWPGVREHLKTLVG